MNVLAPDPPVSAKLEFSKVTRNDDNRKTFVITLGGRWVGIAVANAAGSYVVGAPENSPLHAHHGLELGTNKGRGYDALVAAILNLGRRILAAQPFSVLIGADLYSLDRGIAEIHIPIHAAITQQDGMVHGGVIAYAADNAMAFAAGSVLGPGVLNASSSIQYLSPATGHLIVARASVAHRFSRKARCRCEVSVSTDDGEKVCATAQGTIVAKKPI